MIANVIKNKKGTALLMTVLILNSVLLIALAASRIVVSGVKMSGTQERSTKAFFAAESGTEEAVYKFRHGYVFPGAATPDIFTGTLGNGSVYAVDYASSSNIVIFTCDGSFSEMKRSIEVALDFN